MDYISKSLRIYCDNAFTIRFSKNDKSFSVVRRFQIKYLIAKEKVWVRIITVEKISIRLMIANLMTKALLAKVYRDHVREMGLIMLS